MAELPLVHEYVPPASDPDDPAPAVVVLHGRGANEHDLLPIAEHLPGGLATVSLRAPEELMGGYTWYELDLSAGGLPQSQPDAADFRRSLDLAAEAIVGAVDAYTLNPDQVGLLGFSQGAVMSLSLLFEAPGRYAWIAALHGYLAASHADRAPDGLSDKPVFLAAGAADQLIPANRVETSAARLRELGCQVTFETYQTGHGVGPDELADLVAFVESNLDRSGPSPAT